MIVLFYFMDDVKVVSNEFGIQQEHQFEKIPNGNRENIPSEKIYFTTPSDFKNQMDNMKRTVPEEKLKDLCFMMKPDEVVKHPQFPKHIGFSELEKEVEQFKTKKEFKLTILNAMSNALGDHLIGMNAFDIFQDKLRKLLPSSKVSIALHQLSPYRTGMITKKWHPKFQNVYMMPNRLSRLMEYDAYIDLGGLLLHEGFDSMPMMDFYLKAMSINPESIPAKMKSIKYTPENHSSEKIKGLISRIKHFKKKPVLLFHHRSTSQIRSMSEGRAKQFVKQILENTDYFVVSLCGLDLQHKDFMNATDYSKTIDDFASFTKHVDSIITVDTCTYHLADSFKTPTVVIFTSIDPKLRTPYYMSTRSIMLEKEDGKLFGKHKVHREEDQKIEESDYVDGLWEKFDIQEAVDLLETIGA